MKRFVQGQERSQGTLFPARLDEYVSDENPVRVIDVFVEELNLRALGFDGVVPPATGRPAYHPAALLKIYIDGYLNRIPSSRLELMWLTGQLQPDHKTIARFRKDNGPAIRAMCRQFVGLCRKLNLFSQAVVAIDGSKFKAVNTRDKNFTPAKLAKRIAQVEASIAHYLSALDTADRQESELAQEKASITPSVPKVLTSGAKADGRFGKQDFVYHLKNAPYRCPAGERLTRRFTSVEHGLALHVYWTTCCERCALKDQCTTGQQRRIKRWEHEDVLDAMQERLDRAPETMRVRRQTVEHPFGTIKAWMGATHFLTQTLERVRTEMSLHVLAYNLKRVLAILGPGPLLDALQS
jgi:transposase